MLNLDSVPLPPLAWNNSVINLSFIWSMLLFLFCLLRDIILYATDL